LHVAVISPAFASHVAACAALGEALVARGHRVTFVQRPEVGHWLSGRGALSFAGIGPGPEPLARVIARAANPAFPFGVMRVVQDMAEATRRLAREAPDVVRRIGADAILVDQMEPAGALVAERLGLPFVSVAAALGMEREPELPLPMLGWRYDPSPRGVSRNVGGTRVADWLMRPLGAAIAAESLPGRPRARLEDCVSPLASIWQIVPGLDFPRRARPAAVHAVGPLRPPRARTEDATLPAIRGGRPLVYACLGTLQGHRLGLFRRIARACRRVGAELVVSHCGRLSPAEAARVGSDHVVADLPQREMTARADVVVCHAGLNTVLDAAEAGVPVLALPIAFDQPGVAARVVHSGLGLALDHRLATAGRLSRALASLLEDPRHREAADGLSREIAGSGGAQRAAEIAERALATGRPVLGAAA
jgi:zeaxanthin glucosyltransferase